MVWSILNLLKTRKFPPSFFLLVLRWALSLISDDRSHTHYFPDSLETTILMHVANSNWNRCLQTNMYWVQRDSEWFWAFLMSRVPYFWQLCAETPICVHLGTYRLTEQLWVFPTTRKLQFFWPHTLTGCWSVVVWRSGWRSLADQAWSGTSTQAVIAIWTHPNFLYFICHRLLFGCADLLNILFPPLLNLTTFKCYCWGWRPPYCKPALTLRILVTLLGFWASEVEFVDKFKLMENMFLLAIWQYQIHPLPLGEGLDLLSNRYMWDCCHA